MANEFNRLKMYFGRPFDVGNGMQIFIPSIGGILELENADVTFYQTLNIWIGNSTMYRLFLWELGVDWNKVSDFELFMSLYKGTDPDVNKLLFGESFNMQMFEPYSRKEMRTNEDGEEQEVDVPILYNPEAEIVISENDHHLISLYLRTAFNIFPKVEKAKGRMAKEAIIDEERMNLQKRKDDEVPDSPLLPLVSACINHPGFKYNLQELVNVNFVQFMDSVQRLQIYEHSTALLKGSMSGFVDTKGIDAKEFDFMRDIKPQK